MAISKQFKVGDTVRVYVRSSIKGTRSPANPNGRFRYRYLDEGCLLAKNDIRAWAHKPTWGQAEIDAHLGGHIGLANATGQVSDGLTDGNNPVLLPDGEVLWLYREQIR